MFIRDDNRYLNLATCKWIAWKTVVAKENPIEVGYRVQAAWPNTLNAGGIEIITFTGDQAKNIVAWVLANLAGAGPGEKSATAKPRTP
jgi:hypothetical protein